MFHQSFFSDAAELEPHFTCSKFSFLRAVASFSRMLDLPLPSSRMVQLHLFFSKVQIRLFFSKVRCIFSSLRWGCTSISRLSATNRATSPRKSNFQSPLHVLKISFHHLNDPANCALLLFSKAPSPLLSNGVTANFFFFLVFLKARLPLYFLFSAANCPHSHWKPNLYYYFFSLSCHFLSSSYFFFSISSSFFTLHFPLVDSTNMGRQLTRPERASIVRVIPAWSELSIFSKHSPHSVPIHLHSFPLTSKQCVGPSNVPILVGSDYQIHQEVHHNIWCHNVWTTNYSTKIGTTMIHVIVLECAASFVSIL